jgi:hypothetical protein
MIERRYNGVMAHVEDADYETLSVACDHCHAKLLLSRRDDIGEFEAISGRTFTCSSAVVTSGSQGDVVNTAYEMFIFAADEHCATKHPMLAVMSLAQAWEIFLATFAYSNFAYRRRTSACRSPGQKAIRAYANPAKYKLGEFVLRPRRRLCARARFRNEKRIDRIVAFCSSALDVCRERKRYAQSSDCRGTTVLEGDGNVMVVEFLEGNAHSAKLVLL